MSDGSGCVMCGAPTATPMCMTCDAASLRVAESVAERETIARVVAWLRAEAKRHRERNESWASPSTDAVVAAYADIHADAIERGEWREGTDG